MDFKKCTFCNIDRVLEAFLSLNKFCVVHEVNVGNKRLQSLKEKC